jgi:integrase
MNRLGNACPKCNSASVRRYKTKNKYRCYSCTAEFDIPIKRVLTSNPTPKRNPDSLKIIDYTHLINIAQNNIVTLRDKAFFSVLYLTGARVSEIIRQLKAEQLKVEWLDNEAFLIFENVITLKRRDSYVYRNIPIKYASDEWFCDIISAYVEDLNPEDIMFNFCRRRGYEIIRHATDLFPHYLRTLRNTHLEQRGLSPYDLQKLNGWTSTRPADKYVKKDYKDILRRL